MFIIAVILFVLLSIGILPSAVAYLFSPEELDAMGVSIKVTCLFQSITHHETIYNHHRNFSLQILSS